MAEAELRRRDVRRVMSDGKERTFDEMWTVLDERRVALALPRLQERAYLEATVAELVALEHLTVRQSSGHWDSEPTNVELPPLHAITQAGKEYIDPKD